MIGVTKSSLGVDVLAAIAKAKNDWRMKSLREYQGRELLNASAGRRGAKFLKAYVGASHRGDLAGAAGSRRLVLLIQSERIEEMYFSDDHYRPGSWRRIIDF